MADHFLSAPSGRTVAYGGVSPPSSVHFPGTTWDTRTDGEAGLSTAALDSILADLGGNVVVVKDGYLVRTQGTYDAPITTDWASASKGMLATMLFFLLNDGAIASVDSLVHGVSGDLQGKDQTMTWAHLANMMSGYFRAEDPGAAWAYNDYAIRLYADKMKVVAGTTSQAYLATKLAPLQLEDSSIMKSDDRTILSVRDFARVGWWTLNAFNWAGTQVLPASYHADYVLSTVPNDLPQTAGAGTNYLGLTTYGGTSNITPIGPGLYGYNWWHNGFHAQTGMRCWPDASADIYMLDGHGFRANVVIFPSHNMVWAWELPVARGFVAGDSDGDLDNMLAAIEAAVL